MSDYNYIITVDENGSPCLSHALFGGGGNTKGSQRQNHKYYARAQDKGRWRYFYSPEEFRAWSSGGIKKVKNAVNDAVNKSGVKQRKALSDANKETGLLSGLKRRQAQSAYNKTAMGRAEKAVRDAADDLGDRARGLATTAQGRARKAIDETRNNLGRNATEATKTAKKKIKNLTDAVQEHGNKALSELREAAGNVRDKAEGAVRDAGARTIKAVEDKSGVTDQKNREEARRRALMGLDDSVGDYADSDNRYKKSAKGRADKAVSGAKNAAGKARDAAEEAGDRARDIADRVRDKASEVGNKARDAVREATGQAAEDRLNEAFKESWKNKNPLKDKKLRENINDAFEEYTKTPKGRLESAQYDVRYAVDDIRDRIRGLADSASSAARNAAGRARDAADNAASRVQNAAGEVTGANAKKEMDAAGRRAMMGLDDAIGSFIDAQTRYDNSAGGRASSAASNAQASLKAAQSAAKKALAKAMDYMPEEQIEEIKNLIRGK